MGSRANKYLIAITDGHPALQDELTRKFSLRSPGSRAALSGPPNVVCFSTVCYNSTLARIARVSGKGWVTQLLPMKRLPFGCICRGSANAGNRDGQGHPSTLLAKVLGFSSHY